jgi:DNA invertase Pin-like site-specific DNA recombinase
MTVCVKDKTTRSSIKKQAGGPSGMGPRKPALIGYARVSTDDQNLALQQDALRVAACDCIFEDHGVSGVEWTRPGLDAALANLKAGDTLVVWRLDRLGRSLVQMVGLIEGLSARGIGVRSLTESFDASSSGGKLLFHLIAALAEFERTLIAERTRAGLAAARARGVKLGRPPHLSARVREAAIRLVRSGRPVKEVAQAHGMHPRTLYRILEAASE